MSPGCCAPPPVATGEAKPNNQLKIDYGFEKDFLAPLGVRKIPMVGKVSAQTLLNLGIAKIGLLQKMPVEMVISVLGKNGRTIWQRANGIYQTPVIPYNERKSISTERTYNKDTTDMDKRKSAITAMGENLCYQLRMGNKLTGCISVKLRYSDFNLSLFHF
jgi:DNA polymerase-4